MEKSSTMIGKVVKIISPEHIYPKSEKGEEQHPIDLGRRGFYKWRLNINYETKQVEIIADYSIKYNTENEFLVGNMYLGKETTTKKCFLFNPFEIIEIIEA